MSRCGPKVLAERVGFQWPTLNASRLWASSPRLEQGGRLETLIRGIYSRACGSTPQSGFDCRRLAPPSGSTNPTTPASADDERSLSLASPSVPSVASAPSADAVVSHVPAAPTRPLARRGWSACADDSGRSAFPLEPPSFAPEGEPAKRAAISPDHALAVLRSIQPSADLSTARRHR